MALFRKFKNKVKSSDPEEPKSIPLPDTSENEEKQSPVVSDRVSDRVSDPEEQSSEHEPVAMTGSLFSGMVLSQTAKKQEKESSPYIKKRSLGSQEESCFSFLNETSTDTSTCTSVSDTSQLGFSFIKAKQDAPDNSVHDTSFEFLNQSPKPDSSHHSSFSFIDKLPSDETQPSSTSGIKSNETNSPVLLPSTSQKPLQHHKVSRQALPSANKKKKHKAFRPGQERQDAILIENDQSTNELVANDIKNNSGVIETDNVLIEEMILSQDTETILETSNKEITLENLNDNTTFKSLNEKACLESLNQEETKLESDNIELSDKFLHDNTLNDALPDETDHPILSDNNDSTTKICNNHGIISTGDSELVSENLDCDSAAPSVSDVTYHVKDDDMTEFEAQEQKLKVESDRLHRIYGLKVESILNSLKLRISRRENIQSLKSREEAALSEENYELAEEFRLELEAIEVCEETVPVITNCHVLLKEWLDECATYVANEISHLDQQFIYLGKLEDGQLNELQSFDKKYSSHHAKMKMDLQTMADKIEKEKGHIDLDRQHLEKKRQILKDEIDHRATEFIARKKQLEEDEKEVENEIQLLEDKLRILKEQKQKLLISIAEEDDKIQAVHRELSSNQEQLDKEDESVRLTEDELQQQMIELETLQIEYDSAKTENNENRQKLLQVIDDFKNKKAATFDRKQHLQEVKGEACQWTIESIADCLQHSDKLKSLQKAEKVKENEVKTVTSKVLGYQSEMSSLHKETSSIEIQIAKLQESKKSAVSARQYREASKLSNEEKECMAQLDTIKQKLVTVDTDLSSETIFLNELDKELQLLRQDRKSLEKEEDIENIQKLTSSFSLQRSQLSKFSSSCSTVPLYAIFKQWNDIHMLLIQDICGKHDLDVHDYVTDSDNSNSTSAVTHIHVEELANDSCSSNCLDENPEESLDAKIMDLEIRISKACEEEKFDIAAELDEELNTLKSKLS